MNEVKLARSTFLAPPAQLLFNQVKIVCLCEYRRRLSLRRMMANPLYMPYISIEIHVIGLLNKKAFIAVE